MPSSNSLPWTPDVFVSYDDNDNKVKHFTSIVFTKLKQAGIGSIDSRKKGDDLSRAISQARFALVVFSANYADSNECLDDLVEILLRRGNSKYPSLVVIPIFHGIQPAEALKLQKKGKVEKALTNLHEDARDVMKKEWRRALAEVEGIPGYELKEDANGEKCVVSWHGWYSAPSSAADDSEVVKTIVDHLVDKIWSLYSSKVFGPFGGGSEKPWHSDEINGIRILYKNSIESVIFKVDSGTSTNPYNREIDRKDLYEVKFEEREDIISFSGQFQKRNDGRIRIKALAFRTTRDRELGVGTIDKGREHYFSVPFPVGAGIKFFGSQSRDGENDFLTSIGARVELPLFGSRRGSKWDDGNQHTTVKGIKAVRDSSGNRCIRSIAFQYDKGDWQPHGRDKKWDMEFIIDDPDEYLSSISGYHISEGITSLTFLTNKKSTITIGDGKGTHFSSPATGYKIVGFYGWIDEHVLYEIGAHFEPITDLCLVKSIGPFGGAIAWDDGKFKGVKKIHICKTDDIRYIRFVYVDDSGKDCTITHGDYTEEFSEETIDLDYPHEYLTWISGDTQDDGSIKSLTFHSNRNIICFGTPKRRGYFGYPSNKSRIVGFYGTWGKTLSSIGVYEELIRDWEPSMRTPDGFLGSGGNEWDDREHSNVVGYRVTEMWSSNEGPKIESITFMYENNGSLVEGSRRGGGDPFSGEWVMLDYPEERLLRIRGYWRKEEGGETIIHDLQIVTTTSDFPLTYATRGVPDSDLESTPTSEPESEQWPKPFTIPEKPDKSRRILGFFGKAKTCLNFIGAYLEP